VGKGIGVGDDTGKEGTVLVKYPDSGFGYPDPARGPGKGLPQKPVSKPRITRSVPDKTILGENVGGAVEVRGAPVEKPDVKDKFVGTGVETQDLPEGKVRQDPGSILKAPVGKLPGREDLGTDGVEVVYLEVDCGIGVVKILLRLFLKLAGVGGKKNGFVENAENHHRKDQAENVGKKILGKGTPEYSATL
jgi:hypothetical protein